MSSESKTVNVDPEGCSHYRNKCELLAPCCNSYYRCHHCHNDEQDLTCGLLDRSASNITTIRCVECQCVQKTPAKSCRECGIQFAEYICHDCSLYRQADLVNGIFHCEDCGICRIGKGLGEGGTHWHCLSCCACLPNCIAKDEHTKICRPDSLKDECCICFENMHQSTDECCIGPYCGHFLHKSCLTAYLHTKKSYCPLCLQPLIKKDEASVEIEKTHREQAVIDRPRRWQRMIIEFGNVNVNVTIAVIVGGIAIATAVYQTKRK